MGARSDRMGLWSVGMVASRLGVVEAAPEGESSSVDRSAWRHRAGRLYEELRTPSLRMVRRAFGRAFGDDELEDVYASAWLGTLRTLERRQSSLSDDEIRKYLLTAVAHQAGKELRRRRRKPTAPLDAAGEVADLTAAPDERATSGEDRQLARELLVSLPPRRRAVMLLRYGCGLEPSQVCALVKGLTPRSYRKEITRGVDELTEKLRLVERGEWCADREPLLKAFAAGLASDQERLQATQHLSRCRECSELVSRLSGHLHDLSGALTLPMAVEAIGGGGGLHDRAIGFIDRLRDALPGSAGGSDTADGAAAIAASGGVRGGGAAGAGIVAKIAGVGLAGKVGIACLAGGAVATTCAATGVISGLPLPGLGGGAKEVAEKSSAVHATRAAARGPASVQIAPRGGAAFAATQAAAAPSTEPSVRKTGPADRKATAAVASAATTETTTSPLAPSTPPVQQQFGVAAAAPSSSPSSGASAGAGGGSSTGGTPTQQEFGP